MDSGEDREMTFDDLSLEEKLYECGRVQFTLREASIACGLQLQTLNLEKESGGQLFLAFERGRLTALYEVRLSILTMAMNGSSPAQKSLLDIIQGNEFKALEDEED